MVAPIITREQVPELFEKNKNHKINNLLYFKLYENN